MVEEDIKKRQLFVQRGFCFEELKMEDKIKISEKDKQAIIGLVGMGCLKSAKESIEKILRENGEIKRI